MRNPEYPPWAMGDYCSLNHVSTEDQLSRSKQSTSVGYPEARRGQHFWCVVWRRTSTIEHMVELKGSLNGIGLPAIVQLIGELRHSGSLELSKDSKHGVLDFDDGRLVAADFAETSGFKALATLSQELSDGEFTFVEGVPLHERTLDLGTKDLQAYLKRVANGEDHAEAVEPPPVARVEPVTVGACPLLGFADDRARHYSRPTA